MADHLQHGISDIGFKTISLLKSQNLGIGSYGSVCKVKCDDLLCAAKIIHPTLIDPAALQQVAHHKEHRLPIRRFQQECEFMSAIKHPNIVQYLGTHQDPETGLPVLLMELMDESLTHFLESSNSQPQDPVPYHIEVNFCHDITKAISYLHSNGIIHRDLSSNNVLLCGNVKAKVTDFGMAKLGDLNPKATHLSLTMVPGTDVYMPPEAVKTSPVYTKKIDCFSIGILILQILTRQFPKPGARLIEIQSSVGQTGEILQRVSEIKRRQNHISLVDTEHLLLPIVFDCLHDSEFKRPSAEELCQRIALLKKYPNYEESLKTSDSSSSINQQECLQFRETIREKDELIREQEQHLLHVSQQLEISQQMIIHLQAKIQDIEQKVVPPRPKPRLRKPSQEEKHVSELKMQMTETIRQKDILIENSEKELQILKDILLGKDFIIQEKESNISAIQQDCEKVRETIRLKEEHLQSTTNQLANLQQQYQILRKTIKEKDQVINEKEKQLVNITQELRKSQEEVAQMKAKVREKLIQKQKRKSLPNLVVQATTPRRSTGGSQQPTAPRTLEPQAQYSKKCGRQAVTKDKIKFNFSEWKKVKKAEKPIFRGPDAVVNGQTVYLKSIQERYLCSYNITENTWTHLPDAPTTECSIAVVKNLLTIIGGVKVDDTRTNQVVQLLREGWNWIWKHLTHMPTIRSESMAVCCEKALIVAGGIDVHEQPLRSVEIMDISTLQWSAAADLPGPLFDSSITVCGDCIYMVGGQFDFECPTSTVYTCLLLDLFNSCMKSSVQQSLTQSLSPGQNSEVHYGYTVWTKVADLSVTRSTCVSLHNRLFVVGGCSKAPISDIRVYDPSTNTWNDAGKTRTNRCLCFVAALPGNQIMVTGGLTTGNIGKLDSVEIATLWSDIRI